MTTIISIPKRYLIAILAFIGYVIMFCLRTNLSMAIVAMTSDQFFPNGTIRQIAEFSYNSHEKAFLLSAFSYGYLTVIFGGIVAKKFGGATVFGLGIAVTGTITLFTPFFLRLNFYAFIIFRAIEGIFEAFSFCSMPELWARWAPPEERSKLVSISFTGAFCGLTISYPLCGFVGNLWGWPAMFYVTGGAAVVWYVFWFSIVENDPTNDKSLSESERKFFAEKMPQNLTDKEVIYPWNSIFKSIPVWTLCFIVFVYNCGYTIETTYLPEYIKSIATEKEIKNIGYISSIPHLCATVTHPIAGYLADYIRNKKYLSPTNVHKLYIFVGYISASIVLVVCGYLQGLTSSIVFLSLYRLFDNFSEVAFHVNCIDLAPQYASILFSMTTFFFALGSLINPIFIGFIVKNTTRSEWQICFIIFSALHIIAAISYLLFGTAELQPWAHPLNKTEEQKKNRD